jgi:hypothetical protein
MKKENYQLLGRTWSGIYSPSQMPAYLREVEAQRANEPDCESLSERIRDKPLYPLLWHLGFRVLSVSEIRKEVEDGVDLALRYFDDRWWRPQELEKYKLTEEELLDINELNRESLDRSYSQRQLKWFHAFRSALFLGGLVQRWRDVASISSWFDATMEPEYMAGQLEDEYQQLFLCIAANLRREPMPGADKVLAKVEKCRTKRPRLLCAAWKAAKAGDQVAFNKGFPETVRHFLSKPEEGELDKWVAIDQSSIWFVAERSGLKFPLLSEKEKAAVVTRESAGLA